jgi:hypothetical protein
MVPIGGIIQWAGLEVDIPANYQACDGTNGTPDLAQKFALAAGGGILAGDTGGTFSHAHTPGATHQCPGSGGIGAWSDVASSTEDHLPPYFGLWYIQRMT